MTTPGGVPNLPVGALTLDTMASKLQDMSGTAMKDRAVERFPSIMDNSTGLSPALDFTPFGILTSIWSGVNSLVANADPADITGPEDLPELLLEFIEGLPVIGQFIGVLEAILGTYGGDDQTLLAIQQFFAPVRALMSLFAGLAENVLPTVGEITSGVTQFLQAFQGLDLSNPGAIVAFFESGIQALVQGLIQRIIDLFIGTLTGSTGLGNVVESIPMALQPVLNVVAAFGQGLANLEQLAQGLFFHLDNRVAALESVNPNNPTTPGTALGKGGGDNFVRPLIGANWTNVVGALEINSNFFSSYVQTAGFSAGYYNLDHPDTDMHQASVTVAAKFAGRSRLLICANDTLTNYAGVEIYTGLFGDDAVRIVTGGSPALAVIQKSADMNINEGWCFAIRYDPDTNEFIVLRNGQETLRWEDADNVVDHGDDDRLCALVSNVDNSFFARSYGLSNFTYADYSKGAA